jgi:hypothetical protein
MPTQPKAPAKYHGDELVLAELSLNVLYLVFANLHPTMFKISRVKLRRARM